MSDRNSSCNTPACQQAATAALQLSLLLLLLLTVP